MSTTPEPRDVEQALGDILHNLDHGNIGRKEAQQDILALFPLNAPLPDTPAPRVPMEGMPVSGLIAGVRQGYLELDEVADHINGRMETLRGQYAEQYAGTLLDTFASMAQVPSGFDGVMPDALAKAVMGEDPPPADQPLERYTWFFRAEGRLRYMKAGEMMMAREL